MYVITGATGNTGKIITEKLLAEGKKVRIISRSEEKARDLVGKGAELFVGDQLHPETLQNAFEGATAVYTLISGGWNQNDFYGYQKQCADILAEAIEKSGVKYVVNLSSVGAQLEENTGVVYGLHYMENRFAKIPGVNILHLRPTYFMENTLAQIGVIKANGVMGSPVKADLILPVIATKDIGEYAAKRLSALDFQGKSHQYLLGQRNVTYSEVAKVFGEKIGKPDLKYVEFPYDGLKHALMGMGATESLADSMNRFIEVMNSGRVTEGIIRNNNNTTPTSIEQFAETFAYLYNM